MLSTFETVLGACYKIGEAPPISLFLRCTKQVRARPKLAHGVWS